MQKFIVLGSGEVGILGAELLHESGFSVTGVDTRQQPSAATFNFGLADVPNPDEVASMVDIQQKPSDTALNCTYCHATH